MTGVQLATMSTALWLVATVALFILLAGWSTGTSWGLSASIVRGVRGWADRTGRPLSPGSPGSPGSELLRPILDPYAFVRRDGRRLIAGAPGAFPRSTAAPTVGAQVIDLGERHLPR